MDDITLLNNIKAVSKRNAHAAESAGRSPKDVKLVAVTKGVDIKMIKGAIETGLREFGESRIQEAREKILNLQSENYPPMPPLAKGEMNGGVKWHLIGHPQSNKAKMAVQLFDLIHSVDSVEIAEEINRQADKTGKIQRILVQVKLSSEESKHGISKEKIMILLEKLGSLRSLKVEGLMTIPPFFNEPEKVRPYFRELKKIREEAEKGGVKLPELSMGMTNDFEVAIQEGATIVRVGTAIFGERGR